MNRTKIEWVRNPDGSLGYTSNPVRGECPVGCPYCYVKPFRARYGWHKDIRFYPSELEAICKRKKPAGIFVGSTIELFHDKTIQYMAETMDTIKGCPQHRFYLLTKQPAQLRKFSPFPENCYVGVTATDYWKYVDACNYLSGIEASVKFLSLEPLLSWDKEPSYFFESGGVSWLIIGAQTKPTVLPRLEWVQEIVAAADKAGIPVFLKDNLTVITSGQTWAGKWVEHENQPKGEEFWWHPRQDMPRPDS